MKKKHPKLLVIEWIDSGVGAGYWERTENAEEALPIECTTVGFLVADEQSYKTIASSITAEQSGGCITIPKVAIRRVRQLRWPFC